MQQDKIDEIEELLLRYNLISHAIRLHRAELRLTRKDIEENYPAKMTQAEWKHKVSELEQHTKLLCGAANTCLEEIRAARERLLDEL